MASFKYTSLGSGGAGVIDAPDRASAVRQLVGKGITPASLTPVSDRDGSKPANNGHASAKSSGAEFEKPGAAAAPAPASTGTTQVPPASKWSLGSGRTMSLGDTAQFIRELATAVQAGLPLVPALRTMAKGRRGGNQHAMLMHLIAKVEQGDSLAKALETWGKPFDELIVNLVKAGEASGKLADVLHQAADLLEGDLRLRRSLMSATLYPLMLITLASIAVVIVTTFIVPAVLKPLVGQNIKLPLPTIIVQGFASFVSGYWWLILGVIAGIVFFFQRARRQPESRLKLDRFTLKIPLFGPMIRDAMVARFTRTLGTLVSSGLPVLTALRLTAATLTNVAMRGAVVKVCDQVAGGKTIAEPLEATGFFPPLLVQIVALGERSGRLPELLRQAAGSLEEKTNTRVKAITTIIPPVLVVIVAIVVGFIVASIILPLLQMQDSLK
jgi:type IV pilus assembly protein PilC